MSLPQISLLYPIWIVIDNGHPSDKQVSQKIVDYLTTKFPPAYAIRKQVSSGQEPDPIDLWFCGIIAVGSVLAQPWLIRFNVLMDPRIEENDGSVDFVAPIATPLKLVKKEPLYKFAYTELERACLITSIANGFPPTFQVAGFSAEDTVEAGDLFCKGETSGIWVNGKKVA